MSDLFADVGEFHKKFHQITAGSVRAGFPEQEMIDFRMRFLREELQELQEALDARNLGNFADALADLVWVALGTAHVFGIPFEAIWAEIRRANMEKEKAIPGDPRSKRNATFDVVKPDDWRPPDHERALRQYGAEL